MYNYDANVSAAVEKFTKEEKEFSAFDITQYLRKESNKSAIVQTIYHSIVRAKVHECMKNEPSYGTKNSSNGAYTVYFPKTLATPVVNLATNPIVFTKAVNSLYPTFGSFPSNPTVTQNQLKNVTLTKGKNGKFTVPKNMLNTHSVNATIKFMKDGKVFAKKNYILDKSNVRFRLPVQTVVVQQTSDPFVLIARI